MWRLLHSAIWRDGGSYSATITDGASRVTYVLLVCPSDDPSGPRTYTQLRVSEGEQIGRGTRLALDAKSRAALMGADTGEASEHARARFAEMLAILQAQGDAAPHARSPAWEELTHHAVGGLAAVGFDATSRYLLVVSSAGRGLFDCRTGERIARDENGSWAWYGEGDASCEGISVLAGTRVVMVGTGGEIETGRALSRATDDGHHLVVEPAGAGLLVITLMHAHEVVLRVHAEELRAFGFAPDHRSLVIAEGHTLRLFGRGGA